MATATRAEYGLLRWLMHEIREASTLTLQCLVTGAHLSPAHGLTFEEIEGDGFVIDEKVEMLLASDTAAAISKSMALCLMGAGEALERLRPDMLVVLGDRYELLSICSAATILKIPIAHISGGDVTDGAIDNQIRHAVTKLAHVHFPGTEASRHRIIQMGEDPAHVFVVGEPGLDSFLRSVPMSRAELAASLGLDTASRWVMFTYHPETLGGGVSTDLARVRAALEALRETGNVQVVMTHPNADAGGMDIASLLTRQTEEDPNRFKAFKTLGHARFVSFLREAWAMVGNSSAGIVEAPAVGLPVVNIGRRQAGRLAAENVISVEGTKSSIVAALTRCADEGFRETLIGCRSPYGDGKTAARIAEALTSVALEGLLRKSFHEVHRG